MLYLDPGTSPYKSAAIRVIKSTPLNQDPATPVLDVVAPETQELQATVNSSTTVPFAKVQIWAMAFGTGSPLYLNSFGGAAGEELPPGAGVQVTASTPRTFGRDWNQTHGLSETDAEISPLIDPEGKFHCCIKANTFATNAAGAVIEGARLGPSPNLNLADAHQAQRNMTIRTHATGTEIEMGMSAGNTDAEREQPVVLRVIDRPLRRLPRLELVELEAIAPWIRPSRKRHGAGFLHGLEVVVGKERFPIRFAKRPLEELQLELEDERGPELKVVLPPSKPQRMLLHAALPKDEFVLRRLDIEQVERDEVVGEAHVLVLSAPEELVERPRKPGYKRA